MAKGKGFRTVKGKLSVFGWAARIVLGGWTVIMIAWMVHASNVAEKADSVGAVIGVGIGVTMIIGIWMAGTVIFGIWALLTRPPRALVPMDDSK